MSKYRQDRERFRHRVVSVRMEKKVRYVQWLTLECGHEARLTGLRTVKSRACFECYDVADRRGDLG